jgi:hypothetical protein
MGILQRFTPHSIKFRGANLFQHPETSVVMVRLQLSVLNDSGDKVSEISLQEAASSDLLLELKKLFKDKTDAIKAEDGLAIVDIG